MQNSRQLSLLELFYLLRLCFFWRFHTYQHHVFLFGLPQLVQPHCSNWSTGSPLPVQRSRPSLVFKPPTLLPPNSYYLAKNSPHPSCFWLFSSSSSDSLSVLQWNVGGLRARSAELLHIILICIHRSNLNSSSSFRIHGFFALRSDCTHSRSAILSPDDPHDSGGVIILVRQG